MPKEYEREFLLCLISKRRRMSVAIKRSELTPEHVDLIRKFLFLQPKEKFNYGSRHSTAKTDPVMFYSVAGSKEEEQYVFVPYRFAEVLLGENRNLSASYTPSVFEFEGTLREYQARDMPIVMDMLEKHGTATLGCYPGYGKCLAPGTEVLMYDGTKKIVEEIEVGDRLMGDDSTPRNVLSTTSGMEEMYRIIPSKGAAFSVNRSHILTLWALPKLIKKSGIMHPASFQVMWFNGDNIQSTSFKKERRALEFLQDRQNPRNCVFDIPLEKYFALDPESKDVMRCFYVPVFYPECEVPGDPYRVGVWLTVDENVLLFSGVGPISQNNKRIPHIYKINSRKIRLKVLAGLIDSAGVGKEDRYEILEKNMELSYDIQDLCRSLGYACYISVIRILEEDHYHISIYGEGLEEIPVLKTEKPISSVKDALLVDFKVQALGSGRYYGFEIDGNRRFLLGSYMVTHNTAVSSYLAAQYKLLTVILMHRTTLIKQWRETFKKFTNARLWIVGEEKKPAIFNVIVCLDERVGKIPLEIRNRVGFMVIDEAHAFCTKKQAPRLLSFHPKYIVALSATLQRDDSMHEMIYAMCGDHNITREMKKEFHVYKVNTGIKGVRKERAGGKGVEWHALAKSLAKNEDRNNMIMAMAMKNPTHKIVILTGYVEHTKFLHKSFEALGESVDYLCGNKKNYKNSRILIGTINKIGTGFDEESFCDDYNGVKINLGILVHSIASKNILEQSVGRVFRSNFPNIFHLVDDDKTIKRHWTNAKRWYKSKGGILHD